MKITKIEAFQIETPRIYEVDNKSEQVSGHVIIKVHVDDGPIGLGEASDSKTDNIEAIVRQYSDLLVGKDATRITEINEMLQGHRFNNAVTDIHLTSAIDIALYDLNAKAMGVPVYRLMGGKLRDKVYCCYPIFGHMVKVNYEQQLGYLQRLVDHGHHLFRFYVSGDSALDDKFLSAAKQRLGDQVKLKSLDFSGRFNDWESALRYADVIRHHSPYHFEQPSGNLRVCADFVKRVDLPVSLHIGDLDHADETIERGACTVFNVACINRVPTFVRRLIDLALSARIKWLIGTDQESTLGISAQLTMAATMPGLELPCDPMGPMLYTVSPAKERIRAEASYLYVPEGPGFGVELDEEKMQQFTIASA